MSLLLVIEFIDYEDYCTPKTHAVCTKFNFKLGDWTLLDSNEDSPIRLRDASDVDWIMKSAFSTMIFEWDCNQISSNPNKKFKNNSYNDLIEVLELGKPEDISSLSTDPKTNRTNKNQKKRIMDFSTETAFNIR